MKKFKLTLLYCFILGSCTAQIIQRKENKNIIGVHLISNINAPVYGSFYQLDSSNKGWGFKTGIGRDLEPGTISYVNTLSNTTISNNPILRADFNRRSFYFYATPQYIFYSKFKKKTLSTIAFGFPIGFSENRLNITYNNDPIYGTYSDVLIEDNINYGLEIEVCFWRNIGKNTLLMYGANSGYKLAGEAPFQQIFNNLNESDTYYPGMYKGIYLNFHLGVLFDSKTFTSRR